MINIKRNKAKRISYLDPYGCARYPRTWDAIMARIPDDIWQTLTSRQIAALAEIMRLPASRELDEETEASAQLIAAAPDLLAVLQDVADFWAGGDVPPELDARMRAAIAKATGSEPCS